MYDERFVTPMRQELTRLGVEELRTAQEVDATCARLMSLEPAKIEYLANAAPFLGNLADDRIDQIGEPLDVLRQDYEVLDQFAHLKARSFVRGV